MQYPSSMKLENLKVIFKIFAKKKGQDGYTAEVRVFLPAKKLSEDDPFGVLYGIYFLDKRLVCVSRKIAGENLNYDWGEHCVEVLPNLTRHYRAGVASFESVCLESLNKQIDAFIMDTERTIESIAGTEEIKEEPDPISFVHVSGFNFISEEDHV